MINRQDMVDHIDIIFTLRQYGHTSWMCNRPLLSIKENRHNFCVTNRHSDYFKCNWNLNVALYSNVCNTHLEPFINLVHDATIMWTFAITIFGGRSPYDVGHHISTSWWLIANWWLSWISGSTEWAKIWIDQSEIPIDRVDETPVLIGPPETLVYAILYGGDD